MMLIVPSPAIVRLVYGRQRDRAVLTLHDEAVAGLQHARRRDLQVAAAGIGLAAVARLHRQPVVDAGDGDVERAAGMLDGTRRAVGVGDFLAGRRTRLQLRAAALQLDPIEDDAIGAKARGGRVRHIVGDRGLRLHVRAQTRRRRVDQFVHLALPRPHRLV